MRRAGVAAVAVVICLAVVGSSAAALSPAEYHRLGNAACAKAKARLQAATPQSRSRAAGIKFLSSFVSIANDLVTAEAKLDPPPSVRAAHLRALAIVRGEVRAIRKALVTIRAGGDVAATFNKIDPHDTIAKSEEAAWRAAGLTVCVSV
jgi:hypothetical protein